MTFTEREHLGPTSARPTSGVLTTSEGYRSYSLEYIAELWRKGELAAPELETAAAFEARVLGALETIRAREGLGREVAVITSSGVISCMLEHVGLQRGNGPDRRLLLYNSSVSVLEIDATGIGVRGYNLVEHLRDPQHLTVL